MCAIAVMALGAPSLERSRRNLAPKALWLWSGAEAASRNALEARLTTCRVPRLSTLPPLMRLSGHRPSQEAKCFSVFQRRREKQGHVSNGGGENGQQIRWPRNARPLARGV